MKIDDLITEQKLILLILIDNQLNDKSTDYPYTYEIKQQKKLIQDLKAVKKEYEEEK